MKKSLNIGIIGGSIAGCSAAILLGRAGHEVQVFERSSVGLVGRGGGIATSAPVFQNLIKEDIIDADFPHISGSTMPFIIQTPEHQYLGYKPWEMAINLKAFHWSALWNNLRKRVSDNRYHRGRQVVDARNTEHETAVIRFQDGTEAEFDLVLFADGYGSLGRQLLFPNAGLKYRGYMLWRGLLPEGAMNDSTPLGTTVPRISYAGDRGNFVVYFVPGHDGTSTEGRRIYNWAAYILLPEEDLSDFMVDCDGILQTGALPPGKMRPEEEARLKRFLTGNLPDYHGEIVSKTQDTYVQLIYTASLPAYHKGRICLIGDAGMVAQPFTGSGVFKGLTNVSDLLQALQTHEALDDALHYWGAAQVQIGARLLALGEQMEQAFIWNTLDLATADAAATEAWWKQAVTFPEDFTYEAEEG